MRFTETYTSGTHTSIKFDIYQPNVILRYKGIIQIHHGLCEYSERYKKFAEYLSHEGFIVVVSDFPGHGTSLYKFEQGYFGKGNALDTLVEDIQRLRHIITKCYEDLPYFMLGVDLGSLVLLKYAGVYGDYINGMILLGTCMKNSFYYRMKMIVDFNILLHGQMNHSRVIKKAIDLFLQRNLNGNYKMTNTKEVNLYMEDPLTDFVYTNQAYRDILDYIKYTSDEEHLKQIPQYLPVYLLSGGFDNLTRNGKDTIKLYKILKENGLKDLSYKIFDNRRQDILHENNYREVYHNIMNWLDERTYM